MDSEDGPNRWFSTPPAGVSHVGIGSTCSSSLNETERTDRGKVRERENERRREKRHRHRQR